jgi:hypothetical protein
VDLAKRVRPGATPVRARKRQYWVEEGGRWKIAYEATLGGQKLRLPESFKSATKGARS